MVCRRLLFFCLMGTLSIQSASLLKFESNKAFGLGGSMSKEFLASMIDFFHPDIFFETGTYDGGTTSIAAGLCPRVLTCELYEPMYIAAKKKFQSLSHVVPYLGSSPTVFKEVLPTLQGSILFWLDAHYCGQNTATDNEASTKADGITAIRRELEAIKNYAPKNITILIDDIRGFGTKTVHQEYLGCWAFPTVQELYDKLKEINPHFEVLLLGDSLLAYDVSQYRVDCSPVVKACTVSRLYDDSGNDEAVIEAEKIIAQSQDVERKFLYRLCKDMAQYGDKEFHHNLWYGLLLLHDKQYEQAYACFKRVLEVQGYQHWRVHWYAAQAAYARNDLESARQHLEAVLNNKPDFAGVQELKKNA